MHDTTAVLLGGLGAAISWGIADYFSARAAKNIGPTLAAVADNLLGALVFILIYIVFLAGSAGTLVGPGVWYSVSAGIVLALATLAFFHGLERGPVSIVSPLSSLYPLITTILAVLVFNASLSPLQTGGIVLIVAGVLAATGLMNTKKSERKIDKGLQYALLAALLWGVAFSLLAHGIAKQGWQAATVVEYACIALTFIAIIPFAKGSETVNSRTITRAFTNKYVFGSAVIAMIGVIAINFGLSKDPSSGAVVAALSATYPLLTVFLALRHMKEEIQLVPLAGALVGIAGVVILSLG